MHRSDEGSSASQTPLSEGEKAVLGAIDQGWLVDRVRELVAFPSFGGDELGAQEYMAELLSHLGFNVDVWEIDEDQLRRHPAYATEVERATPLGVVGILKGREDGPTLVLNGHVDVVPPGDSARWTTPPFLCDERDGRLSGRGVLDMKGPLVAALAGLRAAIGFGFPSRGRVVFQSVIGEEDGGLGTLASVLRGHTGDGAVVFEPTGLRVASAQAGALNFRLSVPGKAAHGALRHQGVSAIENFIDLYGALTALEAERNRGLDDARFLHLPVPYPICIGRIQGGTWASSVPDSVLAEGRLGVPLSESVSQARRVLEDRIKQACLDHGWLRDHPAEVQWWGGQFAPCETDPSDPLVRTALSAAATLGVGGPEPIGVPYGSDLRLLANEGKTPGVLFGPGDIGQAHREDESISVDELMDGARATVLTAMRFLRGTVGSGGAATVERGD